MFFTQLKVIRFLEGRDIFKKSIFGVAIEKFENPWIKGLSINDVMPLRVCDVIFWRPIDTILHSFARDNKNNHVANQVINKNELDHTF